MVTASSPSDTQEPAPDSPALAFVRHLYRHGQEATGHSWVRLNAALFGAVTVAIEGGLEFAEGDFSAFYNRFKGDYWLGTPPDRFYSLACKYGNISAAKSFEIAKGFNPYVLEGQRVYVNRRFTWNGQHVRCTSVGKDGLIACSYKPRKEGTYGEKIDRRYTISNDEMTAEDKRLAGLAEAKKMEKAAAEATKHCAGWHISEKLQKSPVDEAMLAKLQDYERPRFGEWMKKRFKKKVPTVLECIVMGKRYPADDYMVERAVATLNTTATTSTVKETP